MRKLVVLCILLSLVLSPRVAYSEATSTQLSPAMNEPDGLGIGEPTYNVFFDRTLTVQYDGGPLCLSSQAGSCMPAAIDDAVSISVNGTLVYYQESRTQDFGPVDFSGYLQAGTNQVRVQLIDLMGPERGGSALWLVSDGGGNPLLSVEVNRSGDFFSPDGQGGSISIEGQPRANVPFDVTVTQDGEPAAGAELRQLQPFEAYGGTTDEFGLSHGSIGVAIPSQSGDVYAEYEATKDGIFASSGPIVLYHVDERADFHNTLEQDEVDAWGGLLLERYASEPNIPLDHPKLGPLFDLLDIVVFLLKENALYSPQVGDEVRSAVYQFTAPGMTTAYLYHASATRNGEVVYEHNYFTTNYSKVEPYTVPPSRHGLHVAILSPATLCLTDPTGNSAGIDPVNGERVLEFPLALSHVGDHPFQAFAPSAPAGEYLLQIVGTGYGPYTLRVNALDENGIASDVLQVTGSTEPGYITKFKIRYDPASEQPVRLSVVGTVILNPDTLNLDSRSGRNAVTAYVELPLGFDVTNIDPSSAYLEGLVPAQLHPTAIGDENGNQIPDLMIKFDRQEVIAYLRNQGLGSGEVNLVINGVYIGPVEFEASDSIIVIAR